MVEERMIKLEYVVFVSSTMHYIWSILNLSSNQAEEEDRNFDGTEHIRKDAGFVHRFCDESDRY